MRCVPLLVMSSHPVSPTMVLFFRNTKSGSLKFIYNPHNMLSYYLGIIEAEDRGNVFKIKDGYLCATMEDKSVIFNLWK